jgi:hypothetical protein
MVSMRAFDRVLSSALIGCARQADDGNRAAKVGGVFVCD